jgi:hypothetical protein
VLFIVGLVVDMVSWGAVKELWYAEAVFTLYIAVLASIAGLFLSAIVNRMLFVCNFGKLFIQIIWEELFGINSKQPHHHLFIGQLMRWAPRWILTS